MVKSTALLHFYVFFLCIFPFLNTTSNSVFHYTNTAGVVIKIVSEYDQEIPQSQTADKPMVSRGRVTQPSRDTRKTN